MALLKNKDTTFIARELLGKSLTTNIDGIVTGGTIVETEAYLGTSDKACHAYNEVVTKRNEVMYQEAGTIYVYLCYGMHYLLNFVTGPENHPHAVLVRAIEPQTGIDFMLARRKQNKLTPNITNGPGKLTQALGIHALHNKMKTGTLIQLKNQLDVSENQIVSSPRVGVNYAEECASWPLRFRIKNNQYAGK